MRLSSFLILCLVALSAFSAETGTTPAKPVILLTGFEPFGGSSFNTSWDIASRFEGREINGRVIRTVKLKVVYDAIISPLADAIEKHKPVVVICFGEGTQTIQIESVARNGYHPVKPLDNAGNPPPREKIVPNGAETCPTGLPTDAIVKQLRAANIVVNTSTDAGGYLCNECFYRLMAIPNGPRVRGFIHLPVVPPDDASRRKELENGIEIIVKTAIENLK